MQLALRTARTFWLKKNVRWSAVRPAPAAAGDPHWCHGFCQRDNKQNNIITLHRTTSAKTRATATLRQLHIPPNVTSNAMKTIYSILTGLLFLLTSCNNLTTNNRKNFIESEPTFFDLRNGGWLTNNWIRKPENLLTIHETFKKVGYMNLITDNLLFDNPLIIQDIYINKQASHLLDSLELTYNQLDIKDKYYREFWQRRKVEKNDSAVYIIIKEINFAIKNKMGSGVLSLNTNPKLVNDTLANLLQIEYRTDSLTLDLAQQDFETLRLLGFHQSAYNLLFETYKYQDLNWNRDSLVKTLNQSDKYICPWFQDNTK